MTNPVSAIMSAVRKGPEGLFRLDLKDARPKVVGDKWGIEAEYNDGSKEILTSRFNSDFEAWNEIQNTKKAIKAKE